MERIRAGELAVRVNDNWGQKNRKPSSVRCQASRATGPGSQRRRGLSVLDGLIAFMALAVLVVFLYPLTRNQAGEQRATCETHMRQLSLAALQYIQDCGNRYPRFSLVAVSRHQRRHPRSAKPGGKNIVAKPDAKGKKGLVSVDISTAEVGTPPVYAIGGATFGWADALVANTHDRRVYHCPAAPPPRQDNPTQPGYTDYWYNRNLSNLSLELVPHPLNTLLLGEGNDGTDATNAQYCLSSLPLEWPINIHKPPFRHGGGAFYAFADGHYKWLKPGQITSENGGDYTFSLN
ncbi:MAG: hypothetical protein JO316_21605 [Abitibacteriaceae bacterium]|nr:hypothetical protein [Abditibacteriaceae bacterium]MBV9867960.1 hypothetical protein [Abditibacteriaceae bacterium]